MAFNKLSDILKMIKERHPSLNKRITEAEAVSRWESAVGPQIAKHARALRVKDGVLWVEVTHPIWKSELHYRKRQILNILNGRIKDQVIQDLLLLDPREMGKPNTFGNA